MGQGNFNVQGNILQFSGYSIQLSNITTLHKKAERSQKKKSYWFGIICLAVSFFMLYAAYEAFRTEGFKSGIVTMIWVIIFFAIGRYRVKAVYRYNNQCLYYIVIGLNSGKGFKLLCDDENTADDAIMQLMNCMNDPNRQQSIIIAYNSSVINGDGNVQVLKNGECDE